MPWDAYLGSETGPGVISVLSGGKYVSARLEEGQILFANPKRSSIHTFTTSGKIVRLSSFPYKGASLVESLLSSPYSSTTLERLKAQASIEVHYNLHASLENESGFEGLRYFVCSLQLDLSRKAFYSSRYSLFFDLPLPECYKFFQKFEQTARMLGCNIQVPSPIGICLDCGKSLEESEYLNRSNQWQFLCPEHSFVREEQRHEQHKREVEKARMRRQESQLKAGVLVKTQCALCQAPLVVSKLALSKRLPFCPDDICGEVYRSGKDRATVYTPSFLRVLSNWTGAKCPYPTCSAPKCAESEWNCCKKHDAVVKATVYRKQERRKEALKRQGLE